MEKRKILPIAPQLSLVLVIIHVALYKLSGILADKIGLFTYIPKISAIDDLIPIVPAFIVIYVLAYFFWFFCPIATSMAKPERYSDYLVGFAIAYAVGFVWLSLFPAVMDRSAEHIAQSLGTDFFSQAHLWFITYLDSGEIAHGLLPSFHTMSSVYCYLGVAGCREIPKGLRIFIGLFALGVVLSTLLLKQHYIMDAVAGAALALAAYAISRKFHLGRKLLPVIEKAAGSRS